MDNRKVSHVNETVSSIIDDNIEEKVGKLSRTTGKKHKFLGVDINLIGIKKVAVSTPHHVDEFLEDFGEILKVNLMNLATSQLCTITSEAKEIDDEKNDCYHSINVKILWTMKSSRADLETVVSFLCTMVH